MGWFSKKGLDLVKSLVEKHQCPLPIVVLTGSGISAESGIQTFRGQDGLWNGTKIEEVCRPESFEMNPGVVVDFYNQRIKDMLDTKVQPNASHFALAKLEQELVEVYILTQNVDDLHERAGSEKIYHIHGTLFRVKCHTCKKTFPLKDKIEFPNQCLKCHKINSLRPDVVFFKETPYFMREAENLVNNAGIFLSIGTSGVVYPAAGFVRSSRRNGALCIEINPNPTDNGDLFAAQIEKKAGEILPEMVDELVSIIKK